MESDVGGDMVMYYCVRSREDKKDGFLAARGFN